MHSNFFSNITFLALGWTMAFNAAAQSVTFPGARGTDFAFVESVNGTVQLPATPQDKAPAVLILHGSGGIDGRGAFHASALNKAGFLTLEIFMFPSGGRFKEGHESTLTHAYGALKYLASRPDVDTSRIGAMGFSWGGNMTLKLASEKIRKAFEADVGAARFAALVSFYPVCWAHRATATHENPEVRAKFELLTGAPLLLLAGGRDDYGTPDDCEKFIAALSETAKKSIQLQFYPEATHGWDSPPGRDRRIQDPTANQGRGGSVRMYSNTSIAEDSRNRTVEHFKKGMAKP
jgi:dienelactone hydrolase